MGNKIKNKSVKAKGKFIKNHTDVNPSEIELNGDDKFVFVSIKNLQNKYQCFSEWNKTEMNKFWNFNDSIHKMTWKQIHQTASKGKDKRGLAYTIIPREKYRNIGFFKDLDKSIPIFELRIDSKIRVHGFREHSIFHLCVLDKDHKITG